MTRGKSVVTDVQMLHKTVVSSLREVIAAGRRDVAEAARKLTDEFMLRSLPSLVVGGRTPEHTI